MKRFLSALLGLLLFASPTFAFWTPPADMKETVTGDATCPDGRYVERVGYSQDPLKDTYDVVAYRLNGVPLLVLSVPVDGRFTRAEVHLPDGKVEVFTNSEQLAEKYATPCDLVSSAPEKKS